MPFQYSMFTLPCGARAARIEWRGVATGEEAAALMADSAPGGPLHGLPLLIAAQHMESMEPGARSVFGGGKDRPPSEFLGIVVTSPLIRVASNFIMRMNRNPRQRMFATEAEAIQWLDERTREYALTSGGRPTP
jgi:hypothetical protein